MKFIRLFFLLALVLMVNRVAAASKSGRDIRVTAKDTIIPLDPKKDARLLRKKPDANGVALRDTTPKVADGASGSDTSQLSGKVIAKADSNFVDKEHQLNYYYGNARITYSDMELDADYIRVDEKNHLIFAKGITDPRTKRYVGRPIAKMARMINR